MIQNLGKTHLFFTVSSLKTTRKTSAGPGYQFLFWGEIFALGDKRKGAAPILHRIFIFFRKLAQSQHISRTKEKHKAEVTRFRQEVLGCR